MKTNNLQTRQQLGCGWDPPLVNIKPTPWTPQNLSAEWKGDVDVCPGYTTKLPEVIEIARAHLYFSKGDLGAFCDESPSDRLREGVEILEGASNECQAWAMNNPAPKAGA